MEKILSIFIDESGNIGSINKSSKYYIISLVIHDQNNNLNANFERIKKYPVFHAGPLIRREYPYEELNIKERNKIFQSIYIFVINLPIRIVSFYYIKKNFNDDMLKLQAKICKDVYIFLQDNYIYFNSYDLIKIYYDNGQNMLTRVLNSSFSISGLNYEFKKEVVPGSYRLFQVADFVSTIKLLEIKYQNKELSKSEKLFINDKNLKKYIKSINKKKIKTHIN